MASRNDAKALRCIYDYVSSTKFHADSQCVSNPSFCKEAKYFKTIYLVFNILSFVELTLKLIEKTIFLSNLHEMLQIYQTHL